MKIKHLFFASLALIGCLASCSKDDAGSGGEEGDFNFFMQIVQQDGTPTRADAGQVSNGKEVTLETGAIFFADATGNITNYFRISTTPGGGRVTPTQLKAGYLFNGIRAGSTQVAVVGNIDETKLGVTTSYSDLSDLEGLEVTLLEQADADYGVANATLYGKSNLSRTITLPGAITAKADREAKVLLGPIISRIEIVQVSGDATLSDGFTLEGIYIDNFYYKSSITGATLDDYEDILYSGLNSDPVVTGSSASWNLFSRATGYSNADWDPILFDDGNGAGLGTAGAPNPTKTVLPKTTGGAWAYNFYPKAGDTPHIILHFKGVKDAGGTLVPNSATLTPGEAFLTVNGFLYSGGTVSVERSNVYRINNMIFGEADLREEPEQPDPDPDKNKLKVWVEVELMKWNVVNVDPDYN